MCLVSTHYLHVELSTATRDDHNGSVQVMVYHGAKRTTQPAELAAADVVLTTYAIIEAEHRRYMMPGKVQCRYCKGKFYPDRLRLHLKCAV